MDKTDAKVLRQYVEAIEEASKRLEEAYGNHDSLEFNKIKKFILEIKSKIDYLVNEH